MQLDASRTLILQRVLPHYRVPLFAMLYERFGLRVVASANPPGGSFLNLMNPADCPWAIPAPFVFPNALQPERVNVPVEWLFESLQPKAIVAEFGLRISSSYSLPYCRLTGKLAKLAFWSHGWNMGRGSSSPRDWLIQNSRVPLFACADVVATYSEEGADWVRHRLPKKPVIALGNSLDVDELRKIGSGARPETSGSPQLLMVGRLTADKSIDRAISIVRLLKPKYPFISLSIIGDGPEYDRLRGLVDELIQPNVRFLGAVYDEKQLASHFLGADLFLVTGAAGLSVNHALAYGLPVIAFSRTKQGPFHHPEIEYVVAEKTGTLVAPFNVQAFADRLDQMLESGEAVTIKRGIREHVDKIINLEIVAGNFEKLLKMLELSSLNSGEV